MILASRMPFKKFAPPESATYAAIFDLSLLLLPPESATYAAIFDLSLLLPYAAIFNLSLLRAPLPERFAELNPRAPFVAKIEVKPFRADDDGGTSPA